MSKTSIDTSVISDTVFRGELAAELASSGISVGLYSRVSFSEDEIVSTSVYCCPLASSIPFSDGIVNWSLPFCVAGGAQLFVGACCASIG